MPIMRITLFIILMIVVSKTLGISVSKMLKSEEVILVNVNYCSIKSKVMVNESPCAILDGLVYLT